MSADNGLASLGDKKPSTFLATVCALNEDGTVSLNWGIGENADPILSVAASSSYINRRCTEYDDDGNVTYPGDTVLVQRVNGSLLVQGTANNQQIDFDAIIDAATQPLQDDIDKLQAQLNALEQKVSDIYNDNIPNISYSKTAPGSGWQLADSSYYKDQGSGRVDITLVRASETSTGTTKPSKPPTTGHTTPKPVTLSPVTTGGWRSGGGTQDKPKQGDWYTSHPWSGAWFYNNTIKNACDGNSVKKMTFTITRSKSGGGWNSGINAHLRLISNSSKGKPDFMYSPQNLKLSPGQSRTLTLPDGWVNALADGTAHGIGISGSGAGAYLEANTGAKLTITFQ